MKKILLASLLGIAFCNKAEASTDVNLVISSATTSGVCVTTGTVVRIDDKIRGTTGTINSTRIGIEVQNQDSADSIYCGYDTNVTTTTVTNAQAVAIGKEIKAGDVVYIGLLRVAQYNCIAVDAASTSCAWIHLEQVHKE